MLTALIEKVAAETRAAKATIAHTIRVARPPSPGLWFIISILQIAENDNIWAPQYYDTHRQLSYLADYAENADRSLETILRTFKAVVDTGRAAPFKNVLFNKEARALLRSLL